MLFFLFSLNIFLFCNESALEFITCDKFKSLTNHKFEPGNKNLNIRQIYRGDLIYVHGDCLKEFFLKAHSKIKVPYILISTNSDYDPEPYMIKFLEESNSKLAFWFCQNACNISHNRIIPIPIGLVNVVNAPEKMDLISKFYNTSCSLLDQKNKNELIYLNFNINTHIHERSYALSVLQNKSYIKFEKTKNFGDYLHDIACSSFVLSPRGTGFDCHRTWESLYMNSIPIIRSSLMNCLFVELPL